MKTIVNLICRSTRLVSCNTKYETLTIYDSYQNQMMVGSHQVHKRQKRFCSTQIEKEIQEAKRVMLAETWDGKMNVKGWWMSEKLDGVRAYWSGNGRIYSRNGNMFSAPSWFTKDIPPVPLDGELWTERNGFQKCMSIVKTQEKKREAEWKSVHYVVFDAPAHPGKYEDRMKYLAEVLKDAPPHVTLIGIKRAEGTDHVFQTLKEVVSNGGEGLMLRLPGSVYVYRRSNALLKVKEMLDAEGKVVGYSPGDKVMDHFYPIIELPNGTHFVDLPLLRFASYIDKAKNSQWVLASTTERLTMKEFLPLGTVVQFRYQTLYEDGLPRFPAFFRKREDITWEEVCERQKETSEKIQVTNSILWTKLDCPPGQKQPLEMPKEVCKYGEKCFRTGNPHHLQEYSHPHLEQNNKMNSS